MASVGLLTRASREIPARSPADTSRSPPKDSLVTQRMPWSVLGEYREELQRIAEFWAHNGIDRHAGGVVCHLQCDCEGNVLAQQSGNKCAIFQGRGAWLYSQLAALSGLKEMNEFAESCVRFMCTHLRRSGGGWSLDTSVDSGEDLVGWSTIFLAEGLQEIGRVQYLDGNMPEAKRLLDLTSELVNEFVDKHEDPSASVTESYWPQEYTKIRGIKTVARQMLPLRVFMLGFI